MLMSASVSARKPSSLAKHDNARQITSSFRPLWGFLANNGLVHLELEPTDCDRFSDDPGVTGGASTRERKVQFEGRFRVAEFLRTLRKAFRFPVDQIFPAASTISTISSRSVSSKSCTVSMSLSLRLSAHPSVSLLILENNSLKLDDRTISGGSEAIVVSLRQRARPCNKTFYIYRYRYFYLCYRYIEKFSRYRPSCCLWKLSGRRCGRRWIGRPELFLSGRRWIRKQHRRQQKRLDQRTARARMAQPTRTQVRHHVKKSARIAKSSALRTDDESLSFRTHLDGRTDCVLTVFHSLCPSVERKRTDGALESQV